MAMAQRQRGNGGSNLNEEIGSSLENQRVQVEELARTLSEQSTRHWQKAIEGLIALPAAMAVGMAATTLYAVSFVTRGFEVFQKEASEQGRQMRGAMAREMYRGERAIGEGGERERMERDRIERERGDRGDEARSLQENMPRA